MIKNIELRNFRSILADNISLEPITVLIGANGSGKSNLVKALEFISNIPRVGISQAVSYQGGRDAILPKVIPIKQLSSTDVYIRYQACLEPPQRKNAVGPTSVDAIHELELSISSKKKVNIAREMLQFQKVLYVGEVLRDEDLASEIPDISPSSPLADSSITFQRIGKAKPFITLEPDVSEDTLENYVSWLGLFSLSDQFNTPNQLKTFLDNVRISHSRQLKSTRRRNFEGGSSFFDPDHPTILDFAPHFQIFASTVESIKRYDLLLHELRQEQAPTKSSSLSKSGENMPSTLSQLRNEKRQYSRMIDTFESIAPHISKLSAATLRTGKEFVEFAEGKLGRSVESWESSDGSLRALAILLAVETTGHGETIIIEEPEQNLHPWAIRMLIDHMREVVTERRIQIILTTHSEHVLARTQPQEIRVVVRTSEEGTKFKRLEQIIDSTSIEMGDIGRLWVKGLLGGIPKSGEDQ